MELGVAEPSTPVAGAVGAGEGTHLLKADGTPDYRRKEVKALPKKADGTVDFRTKEARRLFGKPRPRIASEDKSETGEAEEFTELQQRLAEMSLVGVEFSPRLLREAADAMEAAAAETKDD